MQCPLFQITNYISTKKYINKTPFNIMCHILSIFINKPYRQN
jgi:hypothetical protein